MFWFPVFFFGWNLSAVQCLPPHYNNDPKHILVLYSYNFSQPAQQQIADGFETANKGSNLQSIDFSHEYLDISPPPTPEYRLLLRNLLLAKYAGRKFDLIITVFDNALKFLMDECGELSPESPALALYAIERPGLERAGRKVLQSPLYFDVRGTLELSLRLFPETRRVLFVCGKVPLDMSFENKARADFAPWQEKMEFDYTSGRSLDDILERVGRLSPGAVVILGRMTADITGKNFIARDVAVMLARVSSVPVFCLATSLLDTGVVGGSMVDVESLSAMLGRVLPTVGSDEPLPLEPASHFVKPMVNWQQIVRWDISTGRLPPDIVIINRPVTLWNQHKDVVLSAMLVFFVLLSFIIALTIQNRLRTTAERAVRESEARYRVLIEQAPDAIIVYDWELNRFVDVNARAEKLFGCTRGELLESDIFRFYPPDQPDRRDVAESAREYVARAVAGAPVQLERTVLGADGRETPCEVRMVRLPSERGTLIRASYLDITERKRAEEEGERLQEQLIQARKMESVGRLAGGVAHDFNNMLGVILGHADLALGRLKDVRQLHKDLTAIREAAERSADLTRQLLAFARKQAVSPRVIDLNDTVEGMFKMLRRLIGEEVDLVWLAGKDLWPVKMDPGQIDQLMVNLCINARDAIAGVGTITIATANAAFDAEYCDSHLESEPGDYVLLVVSDNGCGMDNETRARAFEPFFTTKGVGKGTGLGLATVYGIVKQNNGFIHVTSEPDRGTTFEICFPRYTGEDGPTAKESKEAIPAGRHETILLVEDEPAMLAMTSSMLEQQGYSVLTAATPRGAIDLARRQAGRIDLLLTDVVMPEMNGRDLANSLLLIDPDLKCVFMSGYTANTIAHHNILESNVIFLQKPFSMDELAAKIREALDGGDGDGGRR